VRPAVHAIHTGRASGATGWSAKASARSPWSAACHARVVPHSGQGTPVSARNGHNEPRLGLDRRVTAKARYPHPTHPNAARPSHWRTASGASTRKRATSPNNCDFHNFYVCLHRIDDQVDQERQHAKQKTDDGPQRTENLLLLQRGCRGSLIRYDVTHRQITQNCGLEVARRRHLDLRNGHENSAKCECCFRAQPAMDVLFSRAGPWQARKCSARNANASANSRRILWGCCRMRWPPGKSDFG
jgi:hypothetical protein